MRLLKQSTQRDIYVLMTDSTNPRVGLASLTLTITAGKNGGNDSSISPTVTDRGDGVYAITLTTSHTDTLGDLWLHITATGANTEDVFCQVVTALPGENDAAILSALTTIDDFLDTEIAAIKAKTDNLPSDPADASDVAASVAAVKAVGSSILAVL